VAAFIVEAAPQREKRQLDGILGGLLGGGGYGNANKLFIKCLTMDHDVWFYDQSQVNSMADTMDTIKDTTDTEIKDTTDSAGVTVVTVVTVEDNLTKDINFLNSFCSIVLHSCFNDPSDTKLVHCLNYITTNFF
jgi:hypothetical protein